MPGSNQALENELLRGVRTREILTVMMIDIDHFKLFNDQYGHCDGDICIKSVASALSGVLNRHTDGVFRYGGEEFAMVLPNTDRSGAEHLARNILNAVRALDIKHKASETSPVVSISLGGYCSIPTSIEDIDETMWQFVNMADMALYRVKENGRNAFVIQEETVGEEAMLMGE